MRSNAIAGISSMSVFKDMYGRSWLYHIMNLVSGSDSIVEGLIGQALPGGPDTSQNRDSLRCISLRVLRDELLTGLRANCFLPLSF